MATVRDNVTRVKRFRELKATLRTDRSRLLVGLTSPKRNTWCTSATPTPGS
jgi:hypothetical protein